MVIDPEVLSCYALISTIGVSLAVHVLIPF
jgi:hypothetical protein